MSTVMTSTQLVVKKFKFIFCLMRKQINILEMSRQFRADSNSFYALNRALDQ